MTATLNCSVASPKMQYRALSKENKKNGPYFIQCKSVDRNFVLRWGVPVKQAKNQTSWVPMPLRILEGPRDMQADPPEHHQKK